MIDFVLIPAERAEELEKIKKEFELAAGAKIDINRETNEVRIDCKDALEMMRVKDMVRAFGRGFELQDVKDLLDENYKFESINIKEYAGKSKSRLVTLRGRVIGKNSKVKQTLEQLANVKIAIYGKTVSIIGRWDCVQHAREAIELILAGRKHGTAYRYLERCAGNKV